MPSVGLAADDHRLEDANIPRRQKGGTAGGPVFITDRGQPAQVLLIIEDYRRLAGESVSLAEARAQGEEAEFSFDPPPR